MQSLGVLFKSVVMSVELINKARVDRQIPDKRTVVGEGKDFLLSWLKSPAMILQRASYRTLASLMAFPSQSSASEALGGMLSAFNTIGRYRRT
jgi:hypothetical protein